MYDKKVRLQAFELLDEGYSPRGASDVMGGSPSAAIIRLWAKERERERVAPGSGTGSRKRRKKCMLSAPQKAAAIRRIDAGEDPSAVAQDVGCSCSTLFVWRRKMREGGMEALRTGIDAYLDSV